MKGLLLADIKDIKALQSLWIEAYSKNFKNHWIKNGFELYIEDQFNAEIELTRASDAEKEDQINRLETFKGQHSSKAEEQLEKIRNIALSDGNIFEQILEAVQYCSLGQITNVLYEIGGRSRRNM